MRIWWDAFMHISGEEVQKLLDVVFQLLPPKWQKMVIFNERKKLELSHLPLFLSRYVQNKIENRHKINPKTNKI